MNSSNNFSLKELDEKEEYASFLEDSLVNSSFEKMSEVYQQGMAISGRRKNRTVGLLRKG